MSINGTTIPSIQDAYQIINNMNVLLPGIYHLHGVLGEPPLESVPQYEEYSYKFPGIDVEYRKRSRFAGREIHVPLIFIFPDRTSVEYLYDTTLEQWKQLERYTIILPGGMVRDGCKLENESDLRHWFPMGGMVCLTVQLRFRQLSKTNGGP